MLLIDKDMPTCCEKCPCYDFEYTCCNASRNKSSELEGQDPWLDNVDTLKTRPDWCPLKEVVPYKDCKHWVESKKSPGIGTCHRDSTAEDDALWTTRDWWCKDSQHKQEV